MSLYPPSNWVESTVPADAGGCGRPHRRPYVSGKPVHPYALECPPCENYLRKNMPDQWSATVSEIAETYDEKLAREDFEKRGAKDKDAVLTLALARLAGIDSAELPESLTRMISGVPAHIPVQGQLECVNGHLSPPGKKFCGDCGAPMSSPAAAAALPGPQRPAEAPSTASVTLHRHGPVRIQDLRHDELKAACRAHGLPDAGVRKELMKRLRHAGVTNADLQALLVAA
jgi:SAP domain